MKISITLTATDDNGNTSIRYLDDSNCESLSFSEKLISELKWIRDHFELKKKEQNETL